MSLPRKRTKHSLPDNLVQFLFGHEAGDWRPLTSINSVERARVDYTNACVFEELYLNEARTGYARCQSESCRLSCNRPVRRTKLFILNLI